MSAPPVSGSAPDFNGLAGIYRWLEYLSFGPFLWRSRVAFLPRLAQCRRALILGDGDGRFTARLMRENPGIEVTAVDASERMMDALRGRSVPYAERVATQVADIRCWRPAESQCFDLVVTHFFLDCLSTEEVRGLAQRLGPAMAPDALWVVSEFAVPEGFFGRAVAAPLVAVLYGTFRVLTGLRVQSLPGYEQALMSAGWSLEGECKLLHGLLVSELWRRAPEPVRN